MAATRKGRRETSARYLSEIRRFPLLSREEERLLVREIEDGRPGAVNALVESNLGFVAKVASEYRSLGVPFEDLLSEGNLGLIQAARRFDPEKGTKFITYAVWWIRKAIFRALAEQSHLVRVPGTQAKELKQIQNADETLRKSLGRPPTREEVSRHLSKSVARIDRALRRSVYEMSLDEPVGGASLTNALVHPGKMTPEQVLLEQETVDRMSAVFCHLGEQQRKVLAQRFGLAGEPPRTLQEVGEQMGLSRERVRQIELQAKKRLRRLLAKQRSIRAPARRPRRAIAARRRKPGVERDPST